MLSSLLALLLALPVAQGDPPSSQAVEQRVAELKAAFDKGQPPERVSAIEKSASVVDPAVIEWVAKGLKDGDTTVRNAAVEALRFMQHADALAALHDCFKRERKQSKDPEQLAKLVKAIGQHGSPKSIALLAEDGVTTGDGKVIEARIWSLANIRAQESLEQLISMMRSGGREKVALYMAPFRIALMRLTGADEGVSQDAWMAWWNEHKKDFKVSEKAPPLPKNVQTQWDLYWGNPLDRPRGKKRGERGNDPESGGK